MKKNKSIFITGIGTDVGKTVVSAMIAESLGSFYWKPIQSGDLDQSDTMKVEKWTKNVQFLTEKHRLTQPFSPHKSAGIDGVKIESFSIPIVNKALVIEGAGGINVPLNEQGFLIKDLVKKWGIPVVLVVKHYLGSINYTLLTIEALKSNNIPIAGMVISGENDNDSEQIIEKISGISFDFTIPFSNQIDNDFISNQAEINREKIEKWLIG